MMKMAEDDDFALSTIDWMVVYLSTLYEIYKLYNDVWEDNCEWWLDKYVEGSLF
jgi:hypothetical protein